jgi:hypothetical protein
VGLSVFASLAYLGPTMPGLSRRACPRRHRLEAEAVPAARPDWLKLKNAARPAVKREAEEDWGARELKRSVVMEAKMLVPIVMPAAMIVAATSVQATEQATRTANDVLLQHEMGDEFAKQQALAMVNNFEDGLRWAEIMHEKAGHPRFYCPPNNRAMSADQAMDILKWHVRDQPRYGTVVWQMALIMGLQATFPCKSGKP